MPLGTENLPFYQKLEVILERHRKERPWASQLARYEGLLKEKIEELMLEEGCPAEIAKMALYLSEHAVPSTQIHYHHEDEERVRGIIGFLKQQFETIDEDDIALLFHVVQDAALQIRRFHNFQLDKGVSASIASIRVAYANILPLTKFLLVNFQLNDLTWVMALIDHAVAQEIPIKSLEVMKQYHDGKNLEEDQLFDVSLLIAARQARVINREPNKSVPIPNREESQAFVILKWKEEEHWGSFPSDLSGEDVDQPSIQVLHDFEYLNFDHSRLSGHETIITVTHADEHGNQIIFNIKSVLDDFNTTFMKACMHVMIPHLEGLFKNGVGAEEIVKLAKSEGIDLKTEREVIEEQEEVVTREELVPAEPTPMTAVSSESSMTLEPQASSTASTKQPPQPRSFLGKIIFFFKNLLGKKEETHFQSRGVQASSVTSPQAKPTKRVVKEKIKKKVTRTIKVPPVKNFLHLWAESFLIDAISNIHVGLPADVWKEGNYQIESVFVADEGIVTDFRANEEKAHLVKQLLARVEDVRQLNVRMFRLPSTSLEKHSLFLTKAIFRHQDEPYLFLLQPSNDWIVGILARSAFTASAAEHLVKSITLERHLKEFTKHLKVARFEDAVMRVFSDYI